MKLNNKFSHIITILLALFLSSCDNYCGENASVIKFIEEEFKIFNKKDNHLFYKIDEIENDDLYIKYLVEEYNFDSINIYNQLNKKKCSLNFRYLNSCYYLPAENEKLYILTKSVFSNNFEYATFYIKTVTNLSNIYYWSWVGVILKKQNGEWSIENYFLNEPPISFNDYWNEKIIYVPFSKNAEDLIHEIVRIKDE